MVTTLQNPLGLITPIRESLERVYVITYIRKLIATDGVPRGDQVIANVPIPDVIDTVSLSKHLGVDRKRVRPRHARVDITDPDNESSWAFELPKIIFNEEPALEPNFELRPWFSGVEGYGAW